MSVAWGRSHLKKMFKAYKFKIVRKLFQMWYTFRPPEMVEWWKTKDKVRAKLVTGKDGSYQMLLEGEKYPQPNYPRGHILFGTMSKLKHEVKNQIFNNSWYGLEGGVSDGALIRDIKETALPQIFELMEKSRYDMLPFERLSPPVRELHRAMSAVAATLHTSERATRCRKLRDLMCFILQEDDAYRFRFQWVAGFMDPNSWVAKLLGFNVQTDLDEALALIEHAEMVGDMKERQRLFRRIIIFVLKDVDTKDTFERIARELDWKKVRLSKADKYYFRGKYFKCDYPFLEY